MCLKLLVKWFGIFVWIILWRLYFPLNNEVILVEYTLYYTRLLSKLFLDDSLIINGNQESSLYKENRHEK